MRLVKARERQRRQRALHLRRVQVLAQQAKLVELQLQLVQLGLDHAESLFRVAVGAVPRDAKQRVAQRPVVVCHEHPRSCEAAAAWGKVRRSFSANERRAVRQVRARAERLQRLVDVLLRLRAGNHHKNVGGAVTRRAHDKAELSDVLRLRLRITGMKANGCARPAAAGAARGVAVHHLAILHQGGHELHAELR